MPSVDGVVRDALLTIASTVLSARRARRWSQRRLGAEAGMAQSMICAVERAALPELPIPTAIRILTALDVDIDLRLLAPHIAGRPQRDRAHSRSVGYVARRLERAGFDVVTEVEAGSGRWFGFIDILAFHQAERILLLVEVKTELHDIGDVDRQLGLYEGAAWPTARRLGWRPRAATSLLLVLATDENDRRLRESRTLFDRGYRVRARRLNGFLSRPSSPPARGERGLAMFDPQSRRTAWLLPSWLDGRRVGARYRDRADFLASGARSRRQT